VLVAVPVEYEEPMKKKVYRKLLRLNRELVRGTPNRKRRNRIHRMLTRVHNALWYLL
jgi:hypothetical protein